MGINGRNYKQINITMPVIVGALNQNKLNKLNEIDELNEIIPSKPTIEKTFIAGKNNIIFYPNQIVYSLNVDDENYIDILKKIFNILLLDTNIVAFIRITSKIQSKHNSMKDSLESLLPKDTIIQEACPNLWGAGIRLLVKPEDMESVLWDLKVEPLFADNQYFHLEGNFSADKPISIDSLSVFLERVSLYFDDFYDKMQILLKK